MPTTVLDSHYLGMTALVAITYNLCFFFVAWQCQFDKITDFAGGTCFLLLALLTATLGEVTETRQWVMTGLVGVWAVRLALFLFFRMIMTGRDERFDKIRMHSKRFARFWCFQMIWVWTVSLPLTMSNSPALTGLSRPAFGTATDIVGVAFWVVDFLFETISDAQRVGLVVCGWRERDQH
jgi:steroid 5-alpha reductase family enzyme